MEMNRRALYNSLRMNWILKPSLEVKAWQVEDYRTMPLDQLFERLEDIDIRLDKTSFVAFADSFDDPEDLTEALVQDSTLDTSLQDQAYLLIFELWRRLLPEKPCLSILCDEIDHQIHLYDQNLSEHAEDIEDALSNLQIILDENADEGADPHDLFQCINSSCANDVEGFLHDFISEKIDEGNYTYATELLDGFSEYVQDKKWFDLLRARVIAVNDLEEANKIVKTFINSKKNDRDLEFNLEVLSFLVSISDRETFEKVVKRAAELLKVEEDFQTLLSISSDFYHRLDKEEIEKSLQFLLKQREKRNPNQKFDKRDPDFISFLKIVSLG
jgi:hypothetical protein